MKLFFVGYPVEEPVIFVAATSAALTRVNSGDLTVGHEPTNTTGKWSIFNKCAIHFQRAPLNSLKLRREKQPKKMQRKINKEGALREILDV